MKVLMLAAVTVICSVQGFAQQTNERKQIPEGKWVLERESVRAFTANCNHEEHANSQIINMDDVNAELYSELQVKQDSVLFISAKGSIKGKYTFDDIRGIRFDSSAIPFNAGGNVIANKLYIQQRVANPLHESNPIYVSLVYEHKK